MNTDISSEDILDLDRIVDEFIDMHCRDSMEDVLRQSLNVLSGRFGIAAVFVQYAQARTFDGQDVRHRMIFSDDTSDQIRSITEKMIDSYRTGSIQVQGVSTPALQKDLDEGFHLMALPMFLGEFHEFVGIIGLICSENPGESHLRLLSQTASRLDTYVESKVSSYERHLVLNRINTILQRDGIHGIGSALVLLARLTGVQKAAVVYLEDALDPAIPPSQRRVGLIYVENGEIVFRKDIHAKLNNRLGGPMIEYDMNRINDSKYGMRIMGILERCPETGEEKVLNFTCMNLVNRYEEFQHNVGKLFLIGDKILDYTDRNIMESVALQIDIQITHYHAQKKALSRSLHPDQVDFFLKYPKIARWFFENPREEIVAMVFSDICGYTTITRKLGDPRKTIEGAKKWILKEKELTLKHGGFFDKEIGDCAVSLFGPPFGAITLDILSQVQSVEQIRELINTNKWEPHIYAYHAVMYALDSMKAIRQFRMGEHEMNLTIGIEVGKVAIGDLTGDIGKLTAMGDSMNLAARLQGLAREGQILAGPHCAELLETYRKEAYLEELPFCIRKGGEAKLKGYDDPVPYYFITEKDVVS